MLEYAVICLNDDSQRVRATSRNFPTRDDAMHYANTVSPGREAEVEYICSYCGGWEKDDYDGAVWPFCITCGAT